MPLLKNIGIGFAVFTTMFSSFAAAFESEVKIHIPEGLYLSAKLTEMSGATTSVLMLHQCNRNQKMWQPVVTALNKKGITTMTVDFRGYGNSKMAGYDIDLSDADYDKATAHIQKDIHLIYNSWVLNTPDVKNRSIIGASCGGGAASILASQHKEVGALVLFSPSLRPYWFAPENWGPLQKRTDLPILGIASLEDKNAVNFVAKVIGGSNALHTEKIIYNGRNHGEPLFELDPNLPTKMVVWIEQALK